MNTVTSLDTLVGAKVIAKFLGITPRQVFRQTEAGNLPVFRLGRIICARPERLREWIAQQEDAGR